MMALAAIVAVAVFVLIAFLIMKLGWIIGGLISFFILGLFWEWANYASNGIERSKFRSKLKSQSYKDAVETQRRRFRNSEFLYEIVQIIKSKTSTSGEQIIAVFYDKVRIVFDGIHYPNSYEVRYDSPLVLTESDYQNCVYKDPDGHSDPNDIFYARYRYTNLPFPINGRDADPCLEAFGRELARALNLKFERRYDDLIYDRHYYYIVLSSKYHYGQLPFKQSW